MGSRASVCEENVEVAHGEGKLGGWVVVGEYYVAGQGRSKTSAMQVRGVCYSI